MPVSGRRRWRVKGFRWEPRDLWLGVYWDRKGPSLWLYICVVPCLPFVAWRGPWARDTRVPEDTRRA